MERARLEQQVKGIVSDIIQLRKDRDYKNTNACLTRCNTVLALKYKPSGTITHIVDLKAKGNLRQIFQISKFVDVELYDAKVAEKWLKEDTKFYGPWEGKEENPFEKILLSEKDLRKLVLKQRFSWLKTFKSLLKVDEKVLKEYY